MRDRLQSAFAAVKAEQALKDKTLTAVYAKAGRPGARSMARALVLAAACLVLTAGLAGWAFFTPVGSICVDINPSLELAVNRFDRVIAVTAYNQEAQSLLGNVDLLFADYSQALRVLLADPELQSYLDRGEALSVFVACDDAKRGDKMLSAVESCTQGTRAHCGSGTQAEAGAAHDAGFSCGKYQAYLELAALDPTVTLEEAREMTMGEIQARIAALTGESASSGGHDHGHREGQEHMAAPTKEPASSGGHGDGHREGQEHMAAPTEEPASSGGHGHGHGHE